MLLPREKSKKKNISWRLEMKEKAGELQASTKNKEEQIRTKEKINDNNHEILPQLLPIVTRTNSK